MLLGRTTLVTSAPRRPRWLVPLARPAGYAGAGCDGM